MNGSNPDTTRQQLVFPPGAEGAEKKRQKKVFLRPLCPLRPFTHNFLVLRTHFVNQIPLVSQNLPSLSAFDAAKNGTKLPILNRGCWMIGNATGMSRLHYGLRVGLGTSRA